MVRLTGDLEVGVGQDVTRTGGEKSSSTMEWGVQALPTLDGFVIDPRFVSFSLTGGYQRYDADALRGATTVVQWDQYRLDVNFFSQARHSFELLAVRTVIDRTFGKDAEKVWGLEIGRYLNRKQEWSLWQFIPQESAGFVSKIGELHGISGIPTPRRIELLPYTVGQVEFSQKDANDPFADGKDGRLSGGLDGKLGITSDLTMDFTVNPDFGQVEADPSEVNLTAFETFFEEKRPFFIEGKNIFNYALGWGGNSFSQENLFYSPRIGRRPQYEPDLADNEYSRVPENTSIITAAKITGKTRSGLWGGAGPAGASQDVGAERDVEADAEGREPLRDPRGPGHGM